MEATVLDTQTGRVATKGGPSSIEWAENNWSCDCNRATIFGEECDKCECVRYIVIQSLSEDSEDYFYTIQELNAEYPEELIQKFLHSPRLGKQVSTNRTRYPTVCGAPTGSKDTS